MSIKKGGLLILGVGAAVVLGIVGILGWSKFKNMPIINKIVH